MPRIKLSLITLIALLLGFINLYLIITNLGLNYIEIFSFEGIQKIAKLSTEIRYNNTVSRSGNGLILSLSFFLMYVISYFSMSIFSGYILISLIPLLMYSIITTEKFIFFLAICFVLLPFLSREYNFFFKNKFKLFLILISLIVIFIGIEFVRHGGMSINYSKDRIGLYLLAQYSSFGWWVLEYYSYDCCKLGAMTFIGPLNFFGFADRNNGIYESFYFTNQDLKTNIYTGFRFLVEDFSIIGPLVINTLTAILFSFSIKNKIFKFSILIRNFIIFSALLSLVVTPFTHNTTLLAFVLVLFFLAMLPNKNKFYAN